MTGPDPLRRFNCACCCARRWEKGHSVVGKMWEKWAVLLNPAANAIELALRLIALDIGVKVGKGEIMW